MRLLGPLELAVRTWKHERGQDSRDNRHARQQTDAEMISAEHLHHSKLDVGGADARVGGMSISSGSGGAGARVVFVASATANSTGVFGSGLRLDVLGEELIEHMECGGLFDGFFEIVCGHAVDATQLSKLFSRRRAP